jgi:O-antigen/teichoic acid export membrane protein
MGGLIIKRVGIKIPKFIRIKEYLLFGLPNIPLDISSWIIASSDRYFVGFFLGTLFVGYYAPAYTLGGCISFLMAPLAFILPAVLSKHYDENKIDEVKSYIKYSIKCFMAVSIPAVFGLSILSKQLLTIFSTSDIANHSYFVVPIVAISMLLLWDFSIIGDIVALKKKTHISGIIWLVAAFVNFGLNLIFVPLLGILGAALTTLLAYATALALTWHYSFKELQFEVDWKFVVKSVFASILMLVFIYGLNPLGLWRTLFAVFSGAILYFFLIFLFKGFSQKETKFIRNFAKGDN